MPDKPPQPHRRPLGNAIRRTAAQRAEAARITQADVQRMRAETLGTPATPFVEAVVEPEREGS